MRTGRWTISIKEQKGGIMQATFIPKDIDRLLAEADELIKTNRFQRHQRLGRGASHPV